MAIVPFQPSLHVVLIQLWASAQQLAVVDDNDLRSHDFNATQPTLPLPEAQDSYDNAMDITDATTLLDDFDPHVKAKKCLSPLMDAVVTTAGPSLPPRPAGKVSLPTMVSKAKSNKPLSSLNIRRSPRLNSLEGFQHTQLDGTPRKRRRQQVTAASVKGLSIDEPPKPTDDLMPAPVPLDILQGWGLQCGVSPSEVTPKALFADKVPDGNQDA